MTYQTPKTQKNIFWAADALNFYPYEDKLTTSKVVGIITLIAMGVFFSIIGMHYLQLGPAVANAGFCTVFTTACSYFILHPPNPPVRNFVPKTRRRASRIRSLPSDLGEKDKTHLICRRSSILKKHTHSIATENKNNL